MRVKNTITNEEKDLLDEEAKQWVGSCTPWYSDGRSLQVFSSGTITRTPINGRYDLEKINPESVNQFWNYCLTCVRSVQCARKLSELINKRETPNNVWMQMKNNAYSVAVMEWCKGFGPDNEEFHWKKVFGKDSGFIKDLQTELKLSQEDYDSYWNTMRDARIARIAHTIPNYGQDVKLPDFDLAIALIRATHKILFQIAGELQKVKKSEVFLINPLDFDIWKSNLQEEIDATIKPALEATQAVGATN